MGKWLILSLIGGTAIWLIVMLNIYADKPKRWADMTDAEKRDEWNGQQW